MSSLVIVESDAKAKSLADQVDGDTETLVLRSVPMRVIHNTAYASLHEGEGGYKYIPADKEKDFARHLLNSLGKDIYLAFDSDQRGDLWSWMIARFLFLATKGAKTAKRMRLGAFRLEEIQESFNDCLEVENKDVAALYIRSLFSSSLQIHIKRLLGTGSGPGGLPLNYSSLTTMFLLEDRNAERESFAMSPRWRLKVRFSCLVGEFEAYLQKVPGICEDGVLKDVDQVKRTVALFEKEKIFARDVTAKAFSIDPPAPYRLADILQDGYVLLGIGPAAVLRILQKLYNGIAVQGKNAGIITSPFLADAADSSAVLEKISLHLEDIFGQDSLNERDIEGHAILPLQPSLSAEDLKDGLSRDEAQLYELIRCRALASQMPPAEGQSYELNCVAGDCLFKGRKSSLDQKGFLAVFQAGYDPDLLQDCPLAGVTKDLELNLMKILPEKTGDSSGEYYTFDTLFDDLAELSIQPEGPALLVLQAMLDRNYLSIDAEGGFHCGPNIKKVTGIVNRAFPAMMGINLSAYFEQTVNEVITGRKPLEFALKQFDQNFTMHGVALAPSAPSPLAKPLMVKKSSKIIKSPDPVDTDRSKDQVGPEEHQVQDNAEQTSEEPVVFPEETAPSEESTLSPVEPHGAEVAEEEPEEAVPVDDWLSGEDDSGDIDEADDGSEALQESEGTEVETFSEEVGEAEEEPESVKEEEFIFEAGEPLSADTEDVVSDVDVPVVSEAVAQSPVLEADQKKICPACSRPLLLKSDAYGKYWSCSGYPACRHSESFGGAEEFLLQCPLCHNESIIIKRTPTGKKLYACPSPECEFLAWSKPHAIACLNCSSPFLVEKKGAGGKMVLRCPRAGCSYVRAFAGECSGVSQDAAEPVKKKILVRRSKGSVSSGTKKKIVVRRRK